MYVLVHMYVHVYAFVYVCLCMYLAIYIAQFLIDADGKYHCTQCQKSFMRDRHFRTHRCLAVIGYVDITRKEALDDGDKETEAHENGNDRDGSTSPALGIR